MKPEDKIFFEKLVADFNYISDYISDLLQKDVDLDSTKTYSIDYSSFPFLQKSEYLDIKTQIISDSSLATLARVRGDFIEFCRCLCLQIELLLSYFYINRSDIPNVLSSRLTNFLENFCSSPINKDIRERLYSAIQIRNIASHRDTTGFPIEKRIERAGNIVYLYFKNMNHENNKNQINKNLENQIQSESNNDWNYIRVSYGHDSKSRSLKNYGFACVDIYGVRLDLEADDVKSKVEETLRKVYPQYGKDIKIDFNKKRPQKNELNDFFVEKDYDKLQEAFLWFLRDFNKHCS